MAEPDLIIHNGRIFRSGPPGSLPGASASAVSVGAGRIQAIGDERQARDWAGPTTATFDARGGLIMPGFNDAHMHLRDGAISLDRLDLFGLASLDAVQDAISSYAAARPDQPWIAGRGWLYAAFPRGMPTRQQLDAAVPGRPAYFECFDGHSGWANSRALELAGITGETIDPPDGRIVRDATGQPTGALKERAVELVDRLLPVPDDDELPALFERALRRAAALGITAVQDAWGRPDELRILRALEADGRLPVRFRLALEMLPGLDRERHSARLDGFEALRAEKPDGQRLRTGILKSFLDGVVEARTAHLLRPYPGTETRGDPRWQDIELREAVALADERGWQVELHAIGDAAVRQALDAFAALGPGRAAARRHRVEHIETIHRDDLPRFAQLGVVASMQPMHAVAGGGQVDVWRDNLDPAVAESGWRLRSLLRSGAVLAFGSDWPVVPIDPMLEIHAAVRRQTPDGEPSGGWLPEEGVAVADALAAATWGSAYAEHTERERGHLAPGAMADVVVLDRDLLREDTRAIAGTRVLLTVVGGEVVHAT
ncbi:MAG TPA: amidohydrolase [Candidatus Limnocylindrales bacterium]|nr:amidohydrolase [Candidatus Limnocylindrales bacterium]